MATQPSRPINNPFAAFGNNIAGPNGPQAVVDQFVDTTKKRFKEGRDQFNQMVDESGLRSDPVSPFARPLNSETVKEILDVDVNPYIPNSAYRSSKAWLRSYYSETTFYTPSKSKNEDGSIFSQVMDNVSKIAATVSKPKLLTNLPQARDVRVLSPSYLSNHKPPSRVGSEILPPENATPLATLAELLEILGKLAPRPDVVVEDVVDEGAANQSEEKQPQDPDGNGGVKDPTGSKDPKAKKTGPKVSKEAENVKLVSEGFDQLGWWETFLSKGAGLDAVLADGVNEAEEEWSFSNFSENCGKALPVVKNNLIANGMRDDDIAFLGNQTSKIADLLPQAFASQVKKLEKEKAEDTKEEKVEAAPTEAEDEKKYLEQRKKTKVQSARQAALKYLGCFSHDGKDIADRQPIRYGMISSLFINALALRIGASAGKDLHGQREAAKNDFIDQQFKPLQEFEHYRLHMRQLNEFDQTFSAQFMREWGNDCQNALNELEQRQTQATAAANQCEKAEKQLRDEVLQREEQIRTSQDIIAQYDRETAAVEVKIAENTKEIQKSNKDLQSKIQEWNKTNDDRSLAYLAKQQKLVTITREIQGLELEVRRLMDQNSQYLREKANIRLNKDAAAARVVGFKGEIKKLAAQLNQSISEQKAWREVAQNAVKEGEQLGEVFKNAEQKILLNFVKMHDALEEVKTLVRNFASKNNGFDIARFLIGRNQPTLDEILTIAKINPAQYKEIQKKLAEANHYYQLTLQESSFGGEFDRSDRLELPVDGQSSIANFRMVLKTRAKEFSAEDYPYEEKFPAFNRYKEENGKESIPLKAAARTEKLSALESGISGGSSSDEAVRKRLEKEWILPMLKASDFKHGFAKSMLWRTVVVLGGIATLTGVVLSVYLLVIGRLWQILRSKVLGGAIGLVYNLGAWPQWRHSLADIALGLVELISLPFYIVGSTVSELYNETQLLHSRVSQVVYPFLKY